MNNIEHTLDMAANIKGAFAVAIVDYESGMTLGSRGGSAEFDLDVAAPGNSEVMRAKLDVMESAGINRHGDGDGRALHRRSSDPRWPRAMRWRPARAQRSVGQGYAQASY
jgi:hypothetical protein